MAVQSVMCGSCGAGVPYGRLSCPSCGDLLASVAGRRWPTVSIDSVMPVGSTDTLDDPLADAAADVAAHAAADAYDAADADDDAMGFDDLWPTPVDAPRVAATPLPSTTSLPAAPPPPGAYIPPRPTPDPAIAAAATASPVLGMPAGPAAPARAWESRPADASPSVAGQADPAADTSARAGTARLGDVAGWLTIAGAALTGLGFLLPWSVVVIGSPGTGYLDRWGLAGPGHLVFALAVVALLVVNTLEQVTSRIPVWLRAGIPGLGIGALLVGLVWPYVVGPLGADPGAVVVTVGALVLVVGGIVGIVADRHAAGVRAV